jgi:hypothetical protein
LARGDTNSAKPRAMDIACSTNTRPSDGDGVGGAKTRETLPLASTSGADGMLGKTAAAVDAHHDCFQSQ